MSCCGPFQAHMSGSRKYIYYEGNRLFKGGEIHPTNDYKRNLDWRTYLKEATTDTNSIQRVVQDIDSIIFSETSRFFSSIQAIWTNLPLTTRMISSPGAVYSGGTLDYTTDTAPVRLQWFEHEREIFLSESSQFYLELALLFGKYERVFSIYNSFRKEYGDIFHLSEFQHIEYESKFPLQNTINIAIDLTQTILCGLIENKSEPLRRVLRDDQYARLEKISKTGLTTSTITFKDAMTILASETRQDRYNELSMKHLGAWEEIWLTNYLNSAVVITDFPYKQVPFYHDISSESDETAASADIIFPGYREVIGAGTRISDINILKEKAHIFNLPLNDYEPYLFSRNLGGGKTSGFGFGWQRFVQWALCLPAIHLATTFPRDHNEPKP